MDPLCIKAKLFKMVQSVITHIAVRYRLNLLHKERWFGLLRV